MPVPSPRNKILPARGNFADLSANVASLLDGEICYAIDQDQYYQNEGGSLVSVGATKAQGILADSSVQPGDNVSDLVNDAGYITLAEVPGDVVTSVNAQTGDVVLDADDIDDSTTAHKFATAAQLGLADTSVQPGDNVSDLTNDAGYITLAQVPGDIVTSVNTQTGDVVLDADDIDDSATAHKFATASQLSLADTSVQPGDNVSDLTNDAGYITSAGAPVQSVAGRTGDVVLTSTDVGLGNVDNTSDVNKPISTATQSALDLKADLVGGVIPNSQLPSLAITEYLGAVASEAALLALSGQRGDWAIRTDTGSTWVITTDGGSVITDWTELATPADAVTSVNGFTGTVVLGPSDVGAATAAQGATADSAVQPGDNVSTLTNDAGYITIADVPDTAPVDSVNGQTGVVVLDADDIDDTSTLHKFATAAQLGLADTSIQPGDNVSDLVNDAGYISSANGLDAATLDGLDSTQFLRSDASDIKTSGDLTFNDNIGAHFGTGQDLTIYHNGANSYIQNDRGDLVLTNFADNRDVLIQCDNGSGSSANYFVADGSTGNTVLYHYGTAERLAIRSDGIKVTGAYTGNVQNVSALAVDCSTGNYFTKTISGNSAFTFTNVPTSLSYSFTLEVQHSSGTITWPSSVKWPRDIAPVLTTGKTHLFIFVTDNSGSRWRGASLVDYTN